MLKRLSAWLLICQLVYCLPARAGAGELDTIRSFRTTALDLTARGQVAQAMDSFDSAIKLAEKAFGKDSTYVADLCFDAGVTALRSDQYQRAEDCLTKAVHINPNSTEARLRLAEYYKIKGRWSDARDQLLHVLSRDPANLEAHELLALTYQKEGNIGKATEECFRLQSLSAGAPAVAMQPPPAVTPPPAAADVAPPPPVHSPFKFARLAPPAPKQAPAATPPPAPKAPPAPAKKVEPPHLTKKQRLAEERKKAELARKAAEAQRKLEQQLKKTAEKHKHGKHGAVAPAQEIVEQDKPARLRSKAVLLTPINGAKHSSSEQSEVEPASKPAEKPVEPPADAKPKAQPKTEPESSSDEEGFGGSTIKKSKPKPAAAAAPAAPPAQPAPKAEPPHAAKKRGGLVPPPPPVVPTFPMAPAFTPPPPQPKPVVKKPVEKPKTEETSAAPASSGGDDGDFLLDWAGKKKKK